jgi:hypothetical protein
MVPGWKRWSTLFMVLGGFGLSIIALRTQQLEVIYL